MQAVFLPVGAFLMLTAAVALLVAAGCARPNIASPLPDAAPPRVPSAFVGSAACAACHPSEYNSHKHTHHAATLVEVTRAALGKLTPPTGPVPRTALVVEEQNGRFAFGMPRQSDAVAPIEYALGSGQAGMTFVSYVGEGKLAEFRASYFPHQKRWYATPGQEDLSLDSLGRIHSREDGRKCLLCHAVTLPSEPMRPDPRFFGVGCESCHGAGSSHIAAVQAGRPTQDAMEHLAGWPASRLNTMCGKCHGTEQDVTEQHLPKDMTNRLQPYGLMQSQCYKLTHDTLSCITCHNPHANVETHPATYEAACLTCHAASNTSRPPQSSAMTQGRVCPMNAARGCIGCHMSARSAIAGTELPMNMADHFIRRYPARSLPSAP